MKLSDQVVQLWGSSNFQKYVKQPIPADQVKSHDEINEVDVKGLFLLCAFFV